MSHPSRPRARGPPTAAPARDPAQRAPTIGRTLLAGANRVYHHDHGNIHAVRRSAGQREPGTVTLTAGDHPSTRRADSLGGAIDAELQLRWRHRPPEGGAGRCVR